MRVALRSALALAALACLAPWAHAEDLYATVDRTAAPGERALVRVSSKTAGPVDLLAYRVEDPAALLDAGLDLGRGEIAYARLLGAMERARRAARIDLPTLGAAGGEPAIDARLTFVARAGAKLEAPVAAAVAEPKERRAAPQAERVVEVPLPASGLYVIEVRREGAATAVVTLVSRIALVTKRDPAGLLAFAADRTAGTPLARVAVEVRSGSQTLAQGTTDERGLVRLDGAFPPTARLRAAKEDDLAFGEETYFPSDVLDRRVYVFAHQPAYRPGERLEAKGIVRAWREGAYALDADVREVEVRFVAAGDRVLATAVAPVSADLGTFAAGCDVPKDAPTGPGRVVVAIGGRTYAGPFRIEAYRTPTFEIAVQPKAPRIAAGDSAAFLLEGAFYEGGPTARAPFTWTLQYHRVDRDLFPTDEMARLFFGTEREAFAPQPVAQGTGTLDDLGRAEVVVPVPPRSEDGYLTLRVVVTGPDRTAAEGTGSTGYAASPLNVALRTDRHLYGAEGVARVRVKAVLADGTPARARAGVVTASQVTDAPKDGLRVAEESPVGTWPFTTGDAGTADLDVPFAANGRYAISVAVPRATGEPAGPAAAATIHVWVAGERADVGYSGERLEVVADRDEYAVGDVARLLVLSPVGARPFLRTTEGTRVLAFDTVRLPGEDDRGASAVVEVKIGPEHVPSGYIGIALVDRGNVLAATKLLRVPPADRVLKPTVEASRTEFEPGETVAMTAKVTDAAGAPVAGAEVSVAVVDDALHALYADATAPIEPFFHPVRRNDVRTGGPLHLSCVGWAVTTVTEDKEGRRHGGGAGGSFRGPSGSAPPLPRDTGAPPPPATDPAAPAEVEEASGSVTGAPRVPGVRLVGVAGEERLRKSDDGAEGPLAAREDFRTAVWWSPALRTGADGTVVVGPVKFAESLTRWRITARAVDAKTRVGSSTTTVRTAKQVLTRLTAPRFLRASDTAFVPWTLHSLLGKDADADFVASASGLRIDGPSGGREVLAAGAVLVRDLKVTALAPGEGRLAAELRTTGGRDAVALAIPVLPQGVPKALAVSRQADNAPLELPPLVLPATAEPGTARLRILVEPSVAQAVGAALPYLLDYPHGCTEQTMSRLLPAVVAKAAKDRFGIAPRGRLAEVGRMVDAGVARLRELRHEDGGFGWWERDASDPYMTAYVLHGLSRTAEVAADPAPARAMASAAAAWLVHWLAADAKSAPAGEGADARAVERAFVWMALADGKALPAGALPTATPDALTPLARAFLLRAVLASGQRTAEAAAHVDALTAAAVRDAEGVRWGASAVPTRWAEDPVEATAWILSALVQARPDHPDLAAGTRWLLAQRAGGDHWRSTRDTAACVAFLSRYLAMKGDVGAGRTIALEVGGKPLDPVRITAETAFSGATVEVPAASVPAGPIIVRASPGEGPISVTALLTFTETGPAIAPAATGFEVKRTWWLVEPAGEGPSPAMRRRAVTETVPSGALLDVDVVVTTEREREMVMVTSPHAAGFEPDREFATTWAGESPATAVEPDHADRLDDRTVFFVRRLPAGTHVFRHRVRAVHAGAFTALPAQAELMYFPATRGNGAGEVLEISRAGAPGTPAPAGGR